MYYPNDYIKNINNSHRTPYQNSYIRVFNASPNAPAVDVYANNRLIVGNLGYKHFSQYISLAPGDYKFKVYPTGQTTNLILEEDIYIPEYSVFNLAIIGVFPEISLYPIPEPTTPQNFDRPCIRFINLSPNSPAIDISLLDGTKVFNNVAYKYISDYACIPAGTYTFQIINAYTHNTLLTIPNIQLSSNNYYTIYLIGFPAKDSPIEALVILEPR